MQNNRYPKLFIRSKNELAKHISHERFTKDEALALINDVIKNFDTYWKDSSHSDPIKGKFIRNAKRTRLGLLLQKINTMILAPHDKMIPKFIFGGIKKRDHVQAAKHLLGSKRKRVMLKTDLRRFFEQISHERVFDFFRYKCQCDDRASKILAYLCCVPLGQKGSDKSEKSIARGFATSPRLAVWCNQDTFINLDRLIQSELKNNDPRLAIYVDDIGITASRVSKEKMNCVLQKVENLLVNSDKKQPLILNKEKNKTKIVSHEEGIDYVGIDLHRNTLKVGKKAKSKRDKIKEQLKSSTSNKSSYLLRKKQKAMNNYRRYVESV